MHDAGSLRTQQFSFFTQAMRANAQLLHQDGIAQGQFFAFHYPAHANARLRFKLLRLRQHQPPFTGFCDISLRQRMLARKMIDAGASLKLADRQGNSPLALARARGYREMVVMLEAAGAK